MIDTACRITACACKVFDYEQGDHPGVCNCNHFDSNHGPSREELRADLTRLRTALERFAKGQRSNGRLMSWGDFTFEAEAALHPTDNSAPAAAPPPPDPTCPQCGGPEHDRQGRPLNPAPACECPPGVVSSTCKVHGYGRP